MRGRGGGSVLTSLLKTVVIFLLWLQCTCTVNLLLFSVFSAVCDSSGKRHI